MAGLGLSLPALPEKKLVAAAGLLVAINTVWRTWRPFSVAPGDTRASGLLLLDVAVHVAAAALSEGWESPYVFAVVVDVLLAGFGRGYPEAFTVAGLALGALGVAGLTVAPPDRVLQPVSQVTLLYALSAFVAGYARDLFVEAQERQEEAANRLARLAEANELLSELHRVARTLPSSLDLDETLASALARLRGLFDLTAVAILVLDPATDRWRTGLAEGVRIPADFGEHLPAPLRRAADSRGIVTEEDTWAAAAPGLSPRARSGLYGALVARGRLVGLAAIEHSEPGRYGPREVGLLEGLAEPLALAIDNSLWFARLRTLGAEGERSRMARQLHDRIGQGLAYVALELDRIRSRHGGPPELAQLAEDTRGLLAEVQETLHQLRAEVTETTGLGEIAQTHLERFERRTGIKVTLRMGEDPLRLPVRVEREAWRILQEALLNVERHSRAERVWVTWEVERGRARLQVRDDGQGFDPKVAGRESSSGLVAMRERANAIGARLSITASPGKGTLVTLETEVGA